MDVLGYVSNGSVLVTVTTATVTVTTAIGTEDLICRIRGTQLLVNCISWTDETEIPRCVSHSTFWKQLPSLGLR